MNSIPKDVQMCYRKKRFRTIKFARKVGEKKGKEYGIKFRAYNCPVCFGFHLTKEKENV